MLSLRHPNIVNCMGLCDAPPAIVTGARQRCLRGGRWRAACVVVLGCGRPPPKLLRRPRCLLPSVTLRNPSVHPYPPPGPSSRTKSPTKSPLPRAAEYCSRGSLFDLLQAARASPTAGVAVQLTWQRRLAMALGAAKGMLFLHSRNVVHR